ncbi:MAG: hypothetical protein CMJ67_06910 [Planctomycetaceae bacterium]|nr:hypothetical protein [Planctomycetaceae bacterium]
MVIAANTIAAMTAFLKTLRPGMAIGLLLMVGCGPRVPEIPAYRSSGGISEQGVAAWSEAKSSDQTIETVTGIDTAGEDPTLDAWVARARMLRTQAEDQRLEDAMAVMARIQSTVGGPRAGDLALLADLRRSGLSPALDAEAVELIDEGIEVWSSAALKALEQGNDAAAVAAFSTVSMAAADGRHPRLELESLNQASRLMDRLGIPRANPLPPRVLAYTLDRLVFEHVDQPEWKTLVDAGFRAVNNACLDEAGRKMVKGIRSEFDQRAISMEFSIMVPFWVKYALPMVGQRLQEASEPPLSIFGPNTDGVRVFLEGMIEETDIRTRAYYGKDAKSLERFLNDTYIGVGSEVQSVPEGILLSPLAGGPARRAGVREGDLLIEVDRIPVRDMPISSAIDKILGRIGTVVELTIQRRGLDDSTESLVIPVIRGKVERETLNGWRQVGHDRMGRPLWDWIIDPESGIAYIGIREFVEDTDRRFRAAILEANRELQAVGGPGRQVEGLIIDLRRNGGGRRDTTERLLDLFLSDGAVFKTEGSRSNSNDRTMATQHSTRLNGMPVVVIVDEDSASASEVLAGTLQGRAGAIVLGERTHGKGSVQQVLSTPDGYLVVTESWFLVPDAENGARTIDRFRDDEEWGIKPDVRSAATSEETTLFLEERGGWRSGLGQDDFDLNDLPTIESTNDRPLLDATILLRRRLMPAEADPDQDQ